MSSVNWRVVNPGGRHRVLVTKELPGNHWLERLAVADCRVEIAASSRVLTEEQIQTAMGERCDGAIGQLTETWGKSPVRGPEKSRGKGLQQLRRGVQQHRP